MRCVSRNKQTIYYATYTGKTAVVDSDGNKTGEYALTYSNPTSLRANVSAARGFTELEMFGISADYTKTITVNDMSCPIAEDSILWIGITPTTTTEGVTTNNPHNYVVKTIARSINTITYAVKRVEVGVNA